MKNFSDFMTYLNEHPDNYSKLFGTDEYQCKFPTTNDELEKFINEIEKITMQQTLTILKTYHEWNQE